MTGLLGLPHPMLRAPEFRDGTNAVLARARAKPEGRVRWTTQPQPLITNTRDRTGRSSHPRSLIGRRDLIKLTAGAGVAAFGVAGRGLILPWVSTSRAAEGEPLVEPEVRASRDGLLDTTLEASVMAVPVAGGTAIMRVYEGSFPGPTLRIRPGDTLRVNLVNKLEDAARRAAGG